MLKSCNNVPNRKKGKVDIEQALYWYKKAMKYGDKVAERMYKRLIMQKANEKG